MSNKKIINYEDIADYRMAVYVKSMANYLGIEPKTYWSNYITKDMKDGCSWRFVNEYIKELESEEYVENLLTEV